MNKPALLAMVFGVLLGLASIADPMRPSDFIPEVLVDTAQQRDPEFRLLGLMRRDSGWRANINSQWVSPGDAIGATRVQSISGERVLLISPERGRIELAIKKKDIKRVSN